jgi:voltage-gated potassium channel
MRKRIAFSQFPYRFGFLMLAILLMILIRPLLDGLVGVGLLTDIFFAGIFLSELYAERDSKYPYHVALGLAAAALAARVAQHFTGALVLDALSSGLTALFFVHAVLNIGAYILAARKVSMDVIFAAVCAYLLLGMIFAQACYFLENLRPGSFRMSEPLGRDIWDFIYYSFVTLTTLGYGDIVAATKPARALAILEAIIGQLYLAVLIGRLVGAYTAELRGNGE